MNFSKAKLITLLRASEKYSKTDMVYLASGGFWIFVSRLASSLATLLIAIAFANLLAKDTYGTYKFVLAFASALAVFTLPGMGTAVIRAVSRGYEGALRAAVKTRVSWGLIGSAACAALALYYFSNENNILGISFLIIAPLVPLMDAFNTYDALLQGKKRFDLSALYGAAGQIAATTLLVGVLLLTKNIFALLLAYFLSWIVVRGILLIITQKKHAANTATDPEAVRYGKHLSIIKGLGVVSGSMGGILVFHFLGSAPLAVFAFAIAPIEQVRALIKPVENLIVPKVAEDSWKMWSARTFLRKSLPFFGLIGAGVLLYLIAAPYLYKILFPQYLESVYFSRLLAPTLVLSAASVLMVSILRGKERIRELHVVNIVTIAVTFASYLTLIPLFGLSGYVAAIFLIKGTEILAMGYMLFR